MTRMDRSRLGEEFVIEKHGFLLHNEEAMTSCTSLQLQTVVR
jgi:hypothetical protein